MIFKHKASLTKDAAAKKITEQLDKWWGRNPGTL